MYDEGEGVEEDNQEAIKWYRLAAMQGNEAAQYCLGVTYLNGEVGEPDLAEAFAWLTLADESEETSAAEELEAIKKSATANQLKQGKKNLRNCENNLAETESLTDEQTKLLSAANRKIISNKFFAKIDSF